MGPGDIGELIAVSAMAAAGLIVVIGATIRIALGPLVKAKRLAAAAPTNPPDTGRLEARMGALEEEVRQLGDTLDRVATTVEFDAQLRAGTAPRPPLPPASG